MVEAHAAPFSGVEPRALTGPDDWHLHPQLKIVANELTSKYFRRYTRKEVVPR